MFCVETRRASSHTYVCVCLSEVEHIDVVDDCIFQYAQKKNISETVRFYFLWFLSNFYSTNTQTDTRFVVFTKRTLQLLVMYVRIFAYRDMKYMLLPIGNDSFCPSNWSKKQHATIFVHFNILWNKNLRSYKTTNIHRVHVCTVTCVFRYYFCVYHHCLLSILQWCLLLSVLYDSLSCCSAYICEFILAMW